MFLFLNVMARVLVSIILGLAAWREIPNIPLSGIFNIAQFSVLLSLCIVPLPWKRMMLLEEVMFAREDLVAKCCSYSCLLDPSNGGRCAVAANRLSGTPAEGIIRLQFVGKLANSKADKLQEALWKSFVPVLLLCITLFIAAYVINTSSTPLLLDNGLDLKVVSGMFQVIGSIIVFVWSLAFTYGEIAMYRDAARAAL